MKENVTVNQPAAEAHSEGEATTRTTHSPTNYYAKIGILSSSPGEKHRLLLWLLLSSSSSFSLLSRGVSLWGCNKRNVTEIKRSCSKSTIYPFASVQMNAYLNRGRGEEQEKGLRRSRRRIGEIIMPFRETIRRHSSLIPKISA